MNSIPEDRLDQLDKMFQSYVMTAEGAEVFVCDVKNDYSRWTRRMVEVFGLPGEYMEGAGFLWTEHVHPDDRSAYEKEMAGLASGRNTEHDMQYRAMDKDGLYHTCTCRGMILEDKEGNPDYFTGIIRDHDDLGGIDTLTGLPNQARFFGDLKRFIDKKVPVVIGMFGTTHFSRINDLYGYDMANRILGHNAQWTSEYFSTVGQLYRLDGIKLGLISPKLTIDELREKAQFLKGLLKKGYELEGKWIQMPHNGGGLYVDRFDMSLDTVYSCLTHAYEISKHSMQGNFYAFENVLTLNHRTKIDLINEVRDSVLDGCRGFMIYYQPIVSADDNEQLIGAEALIRWRDDDNNVVPPNEFIPVLENDALFPVLGKWILRMSMEECLPLLKKYPDFVLNVNLSYVQLEQDDFVDSVLTAIRELGYPAGNLCLEITERGRLIDMERLANINYQLIREGVSFALDDYGTGFSSMNVLKRLKFRTVKLDRQFVLNITEDERELELVNNISQQAKIFGADTCVEGVETDEMKKLLQESGADKLQGFYYSRPIPMSEFMMKYGK